jgi:hypothetical protein
MNLRTGKVLPDLQKPQPRIGSKEHSPPAVDPAAQLDKHEVPVMGEQDPCKVDYNVVAHLKCILVLLSVYDALLLVLELHHALIKALRC